MKKKKRKCNTRQQPCVFVVLFYFYDAGDTKVPKCSRFLRTFSQLKSVLIY